MVITLQAYRHSIGTFNGAKCVVEYRTNCEYIFLLGTTGLFLILIVMQLLFLSGDIELNPGPDDKSWGDISVCQLNARSLPDKLSAIKNNPTQTFYIIAVTET